MNSENKDREDRSVVGLHIHRGMLMPAKDGKLTRRSMRKGSGKRKHLGDGLTNVGISVNELSDRERVLKNG